jgi:small multidrug resistance pump
VHDPQGDPVLRSYLFLIAAIVAEVIATTALARSESFSRLWPSNVTVVFYALAFWCLSFPLRVMPTGVVYAIWSGLGIVFIALIGFVLFGQRLDLPALLGLAMIVGGIAVIHLFSGANPH